MIMCGFVRYVFRCREGFREYLMYPLTVLGTFFLVNLVVLIYWLANGRQNEQVLSMYELGGTAIAGISCSYLTDRILRISVSFGVSRKTYLRGMFFILPVFAAVTAAVIQLAVILTDGIFFLDGSSLDTPALVVCSEGYGSMSPYPARVLILNLTVTFCLCITAFGISLLYAGCRNRSGRFAGMLAVGFCSLGVVHLIVYSCDVSLGSPGFRYSGTLLGFIIQMIVPCMDSMGFGQHYPMKDSFYIGIVLLIAYAAVFYLVVFAFFAILTKRAEICGKEQGGQI